MTDRALTTVTIDGTQYSANFEYTHQAVAVAFQTSLQSIVDVFNLQEIDSGGTITTIADQIDSGGYQGLVQTSIAELLDLAQNGVVANVDPNDPGSPTAQYYLSVEMARDLDLLLNSLKASGATNPAAITADQLKLWRSMAAQTPSIQNIMQSVIDTSSIANRSLQALTELIYVKTGNEVMADSLESLEEALGVTKGTLDTLTDLQNLHNRLIVSSKVAFSALFSFDPPGTNETGFVQAYQSLASAYFGQPLVPELDSDLAIIVQKRDASGNAVFETLRNPESSVAFKLTSAYAGLSTPPSAPTQFPLFSAIPGPGFISALNELITYRERLKDQIQELSAVLPTSTNASGLIVAVSDEGTLHSRLQKVLADINKHLTLQVQTGTSTTMSTNSAGSAISVPVQLFSNELVTFSNIAGNENAAFSGFRLWMLDNFDKRFGTSDASPADAGQIQKNITFAITAGESLNDTQKEKVRRFLFVFEEYYKSASAILTKITQLIEKMAQSIGR